MVFWRTILPILLQIKCLPEVLKEVRVDVSIEQLGPDVVRKLSQDALPFFVFEADVPVVHPFVFEVGFDIQFEVLVDFFVLVEVADCREEGVEALVAELFVEGLELVQDSHEVTHDDGEESYAEDHDDATYDSLEVGYWGEVTKADG